jgi:hypothetical protein
VIDEINASLLEAAKLFREAAEAADSFRKAAEAAEKLAAVYSGAPAPEVQKPEKTERKIDEAYVRGVLAEMSRAGHTQEAKALLRKYNAEKLSDLAKESYAALLTDEDYAEWLEPAEEKYRKSLEEQGK